MSRLIPARIVCFIQRVQILSRFTIYKTRWIYYLIFILFVLCVIVRSLKVLIWRSILRERIQLKLFYDRDIEWWNCAWIMVVFLLLCYIMYAFVRSRDKFVLASRISQGVWLLWILLVRKCSLSVPADFQVEKILFLSSDDFQKRKTLYFIPEPYQFR